MRKTSKLFLSLLATLAIIYLQYVNVCKCQNLPSIDSTRLLNLLSPYYKLDEDAFSSPQDFIRARHFIAETHYVKTKDNYILTLHRIVNPLIPKSLRSLLKPVILQHGLWTSSYNFIVSSDKNRDRPQFNLESLTSVHPNVASLYNTNNIDDDGVGNFAHSPLSLFSWQKMLTLFKDLTSAKLLGLSDHSDTLSADGKRRISDALAFSLANEAYDVWMPNSRGSTYSLNHTRYDYKTDWQYWDFSFHEMAMFDLPACIEYVLSVRNRKSLAYIGHSQGNLMMFILQSTNPYYWASKVKPFIALAPVAFVPNVYFGLPRALLNIVSPIVTLTKVNELIKGQILPKNDLTERSSELLCLPKWTEPICDIILTLMLGNNFLRANRTLTPTVAHHIPEGTSILNILHFAQMIKTNQFRSFDFGPSANLKRYGTTINPFYKIERIVSPDIAFVSGKTDTLATISNVAITRSMLRVKLKDDFVVPDAWWGHADYMYAIGVGKLVNARLIALINEYRLVH